MDRPRRGNRVLWIFVVPIKFSLCSHQVHNGFPNVFQVGPHFVPYALPNFIFLELAAKFALICLRYIVLYGGVSKVWSIVQDGQIKETHAKLNVELEMHHKQINKHHTKYGILEILAYEKAQTSTHMVVSLHKHPHIVSVVI